MTSDREAYTAFMDKVRAMKARYEGQIDFNSDAYSDFPMDIIEAGEDIEELGPLILGIANASFDEEQLSSALSVLSVRLWHLIQHLQGVERSLKDY